MIFFVKVKRNNIPCLRIFRGFNDEIYIKDIVKCEPYEIIRYNNGRIYKSRTTEYSVWFFNWYDLVKIQTENEKEYYVPVKNSKSFIEEVHKRMDALNDKENVNEQ